MESQGDYINSMENPSLVSATDIQPNLSELLIIDIRIPEEYSAGHIPGSINLNHKNLMPFFDTTDISAYSKVIIVSKNGQSASYYTSALRIYGVRNVYALRYGMASWHSDFAEDWLFNIHDIPTIGGDNHEHPKPNNSPFPKLTFSKQGITVKEKLKERISTVLNENFNESDFYYEEGEININDEMLNRRMTLERKEDFIICYGIQDLYLYFRIGVHIPDAVSYLPPKPSDLSSSKYLQTIPSSKKIIIYDYDGHLSAFLTAYLRVLGYDAVSLMYGYNTLYPSAMKQIPALEQYIFSEEDIMNYPYLKETP